MKIKYLIASLMALSMVLTFGGQALAVSWNWGGGNSDDNANSTDPITITNTNTATVVNNVSVSAETGDNVSDGGDSESESENNVFGNRCNSGCCNNECDEDENMSMGGNGGDITTGDAIANSLIVNVVNTNYNEVSSTAYGRATEDPC